MQLRSYSFSSLFIKITLLASVAQFGVAQPDEPVVGFSDHSLLTGFPDSTIVERDLQRDSNYRLVLGGLERVRGDVIPEESQRLRGAVTTLTYEVSQSFRGEDVYQFFLDQLEERSYEVLFNCTGRGCGSSNYWANDIFRNRILYGPERNQYYLAFRANSGLESDPHFALYIITRVNRKIYAHIQVVEPGGTRELEQIVAPGEAPPIAVDATVEQEILLDRLRRRGSVILPEIAFQSGDRLPAMFDITPIVDALNADQSVNVYLVAHLTAEDQSLDELMRRSTMRANALREALVAAGIDAARIQAAGVGPLAPSCEVQSCAERIELVLR